jgi:hypothetical protein
MRQALVVVDPMQAEPVHSLPSWVGIESGTIAPQPEETEHAPADRRLECVLCGD